jgi:hypothetical protein
MGRTATRRSGAALLALAHVTSITAALQDAYDPAPHAAPVVSLRDAYDPVPYAASVVSFLSVRVTVLSPHLVRVERGRSSGGTAGDDRATLAVVNRRLPTPAFNVSQLNATAVRISTSVLELTYVETPLVPKDTCAAPRTGFTTDGGHATAAHPGGDIVANASECCAICNTDPDCTTWTFDPTVTPPFPNCQVLAGVMALVPASGVVVGMPQPVLPRGALRIHSSIYDIDWTLGDVDGANLNGTYSGLDCYSTPGECYREYHGRLAQGLLSTSGYAWLDDSRTGRLVDAPDRPAGIPAWWAPADVDALDGYFGAWGLDHRAALAGWAAILGSPTMPPRAALGLWWSR